MRSNVTESVQRSDSSWATCGSRIKHWQTVTCSRSWHCVCSIGKGFHHQGAWHRRRCSEIGCISQFWSTRPSHVGHQARWLLCLLNNKFANTSYSHFVWILIHMWEFHLFISLRPPQTASLPTLRCWTAGPTFTTRPEASCPSTIGSLTTKSPILPCCQ